MAKYPMPMSRYLREREVNKLLQEAERTKKFNAAADKLLPGWERKISQPPKRTI